MGQCRRAVDGQVGPARQRAGDAGGDRAIPTARRQRRADQVEEQVFAAGHADDLHPRRCAERRGGRRLARQKCREQQHRAGDVARFQRGQGREQDLGAKTVGHDVDAPSGRQDADAADQRGQRQPGAPGLIPRLTQGAEAVPAKADGKRAPIVADAKVMRPGNVPGAGARIARQDQPVGIAGRMAGAVAIAVDQDHDRVRCGQGGQRGFKRGGRPGMVPLATHGRDRKMGHRCDSVARHKMLW